MATLPVEANEGKHPHCCRPFTRNNVTLDDEEESSEDDEEEEGDQKQVPGRRLSNLATAMRSSISTIGGRLVNGLRKPSDASLLASRLRCDFNQLSIKVPGCHGNSVFKFEILEGE
jgi:hypothetical protein